MSKLVQYIIFSGDLVKVLKWPLGAIIAQGCHASSAVNDLYRDDGDTKRYFKDLDNMPKVIVEVNNL